MKATWTYKYKCRLSVFSIVNAMKFSHCSVSCTQNQKLWCNFGTMKLAIAHARIAYISKPQNGKNEDTLTVNQREKVSEDGESLSHFFGTIWSAGAVSGKASKLRCSALLFSDMPDSTRSRSGHFTSTVLMPKKKKESHSPNSKISCGVNFITIRPMKFTESPQEGFALRQHAAAWTCKRAALSFPCRSCRSSPGLWSATATLHQLSICLRW